MQVVSLAHVKGDSLSAIWPIPQTTPEWQLYAAIWVRQGHGSARSSDWRERVVCDLPL